MTCCSGCIFETEKITEVVIFDTHQHRKINYSKWKNMIKDEKKKNTSLAEKQRNQKNTKQTLSNKQNSGQTQKVQNMLLQKQTNSKIKENKQLQDRQQLPQINLKNCTKRSTRKILQESRITETEYTSHRDTLFDSNRYSFRQQVDKQIENMHNQYVQLMREHEKLANQKQAKSLKYDKNIGKVQTQSLILTIRSKERIRQIEDLKAILKKRK